MSDTPVTLHRWERFIAGDGMPGFRYAEVGEFVSRPWCKTHNSHYETTMDSCVDVRLWNAHADIDLLTRDDFDPLADCELVDILVQVIPDDH